MKKLLLLFLIPLLVIFGCSNTQVKKVVSINLIPYYLYYFNNKIFAIGENQTSVDYWLVIEVSSGEVKELVTLKTPPQFPQIFKENLIIFGDNIRINLNDNQIFNLNCPEGAPDAVFLDNSTLIAQFSRKIWFYQGDESKEISIPEDFRLLNVNEEEMIFFDNKQSIYFTDKEFNINRQIGLILDHNYINHLISLNPQRGFVIANPKSTNIYLYLSDQLSSFNIPDGLKDIRSTPAGIVLIGTKVYLMDIQGNHQIIYSPTIQYQYYGKSFDGETIKLLFVNSVLNKSVIVSLSENGQLNLSYYPEKYVSLTHFKDNLILGSNSEIILIRKRINN